MSRWALLWKLRAKHWRRQWGFQRELVKALTDEIGDARDQLVDIVRLRVMVIHYLGLLDKHQDEKYLEENFHREDLFDELEEAEQALREMVK